MAKARSAVAKGSYYKTRTKAWLEKRGYAVAFMERMMLIHGKPKPGWPTGVPVPPMPIKRDQFGADLLAMTVTDLAFIQVKLHGAGKRSVAEAVRAFTDYPFPPFAQRWVVIWTPGAREPEVIDAATYVIRGEKSDAGQETLF